MSKTFDPFDELAAMFLTTPQAAELRNASRQAGSAEISGQVPRNGSSRSSSSIELLIAGHLPVRGGLWLTPYADALARNTGVVGFIRLDGDEPMFQLLDATGGIAGGREPMEATLEQTIRNHAADVDLWVIRAPSTAPPQSLALAGADRITILSGADEAAIVAAYQLIKDLAHAAMQMNRRLCLIGIAIVGADGEAAKAAVERLNRTTRSFLEVEVKLSMSLPRIDAGIKSARCAMFPGQAAPSLEQVMTWTNQAKLTPRKVEQSVAGRLYADRDAGVLHASDVLESPPAESPPQRSALKFEPQLESEAAAPTRPFLPQPPIALPPAAQDHVRIPESPDLHSAIAGSCASPPHPVDSRPTRAQVESDKHVPLIETTAVAQQSAKLPPKPSVHVESKDPATPHEPDDHGQPVPLSNFVRSLTPLPIRCPGHERIEIAIDKDGRAHLLAREQSLREMQIVESWLKAHRELIVMACPQHHIDCLRKPVLHLFTAEPASLADLHGTDLRLHVLAPVVVNGQTGWYAAPLSR